MANSQAPYLVMSKSSHRREKRFREVEPFAGDRTASERQRQDTNPTTLSLPGKLFWDLATEGRQSALWRLGSTIFLPPGDRSLSEHRTPHSQKAEPTLTC